MAKTTAEKIEIMRAFEEGKKIECQFDKTWIVASTPNWNWKDYDYRVKEEPKYRPYEDTEELINNFCERSGDKRSKMGEPFIWFKSKDDSTKVLMTHIDKYCIGAAYIWNMQELFDKYTYLDGTPCGKEVK